ncbi:uncharacterized protein LOC143905291 isoform X2 [Temnothorax americanus]|uniref:uncharacterized protein LOC143905291 isoform X2 n=1 Tax=Temnothorax americanus TaxID=1964332 RepID=UPI004067A2EE
MYKSKFLKGLNLLKMSPEATDDTTTSHSTLNDFNIDLLLHLISPVTQDLLMTVCGNIKSRWKCESRDKSYVSQGSLLRRYRLGCHADLKFC